ncbi:MAG: glutathione S-transferase family protein [Candidatus Omnitrophica bacterium]|nr:glutathione S-transferase family protein [Candidatus Omnitrophota bacterium]
MLKIYGGDLSSFCNKVRLAANAMGIEYEYIKINFKDKQHKTPEFLKMHPAGKIPVIDDDGFIVFESNAIIKYLAEKNNSDLYPEDIKKKAEVDQWIDFCSFHVGSAMDKILFNKVFAPRIKVPVDERAIQDGYMFLNRYLPVIEEQLGKNKFLAGSQATLADINLLAILDPCEVADIDLLPYDNLSRWREMLKRQDFYTKCYKEYGESLPRREK